MLSMDGRIIGINTFTEVGDYGAEGLGFAISATTVKERLPTLRTNIPTPAPEPGHLFGPVDGELVADPTDGRAAAGGGVGIDVSDVEVEAIFINPHSSYSGGFSYGFQVRWTGSGSLIFVLADTGYWRIMRWVDGTDVLETLAGDTTDIPFSRNEGEEVHLRVVVKEEWARFYVNYTQVQGRAIYVGGAADHGDVTPVASMFWEHQLEGGVVTRFGEFKGRVPSGD